MSRVFTRKQPSARLASMKSENHSNITGGIFTLGVLLSIYSILGNDTANVASGQLYAAAAAAGLFLIGGYRIGLIRR